MTPFFCIHCKSPIEASDTFCKHCGTGQRPLFQATAPAVKASRSLSFFLVAFFVLLLGGAGALLYLRRPSETPSVRLSPADTARPVRTSLPMQPPIPVAALPSESRPLPEEPRRQPESEPPPVQASALSSLPTPPDQQALDAARLQAMQAEEERRQREQADMERQRERERAKEDARQAQVTRQQQVSYAIRGLEFSVKEYEDLVKESQQLRRRSAYSAQIIAEGMGRGNYVSKRVSTGVIEARQALSLWPSLVNNPLFPQFYVMDTLAFPILPDADLDWMLRDPDRFEFASLRHIRRR